MTASVAVPHVNCSKEPTHQHRARDWKGRKYRFSSLRVIRPGIEPGQPVSVACSQPAATLKKVKWMCATKQRTIKKLVF